jgi:hypothetical protein
MGPGTISATADSRVLISRLTVRLGNLCARVELVRQELEMNDRPSLVFFSLIGASLCAAAILIALLVAGDVAGPRVAMNNLPPITAR